MKRLEYELRQRGITQARLAKEIGMAQSNLSNYMRGYGRISAKHKQLIVEALMWPEGKAEELFQELEVSNV